MTVRAQDVKGEPFEITGEDLLARALLHEIDHLNGILFISTSERFETGPDQTQDQEAAEGRRVGVGALTLSFSALPNSPSPRSSASLAAGHACLGVVTQPDRPQGPQAGNSCRRR